MSGSYYRDFCGGRDNLEPRRLFVTRKMAVSGAVAKAIKPTSHNNTPINRLQVFSQESHRFYCLTALRAKVRKPYSFVDLAGELC
jgi:hypothetical protein